MSEKSPVAFISHDPANKDSAEALAQDRARSVIALSKTRGQVLDKGFDYRNLEGHAPKLVCVLEESSQRQIGEGLGISKTTVDGVLGCDDAF